MPRLSLRPSPGSTILAIFVLSGAAGLVYEVVWSRQLVLVFGNTTQAVSAILTGFFGGMAIGSVAGGRLGDRVRSPLRLYGAIELVLVGMVLLTPLLFRALHDVYRGFYGSLETTPLLLGLVRFVLALVALGPATILMGATLPTLSRFLARDRAAGLSRQFGRLYAANTLGAIFGAALSGFVLIELLGLTGTLIVGAVCSATAGLVAIALSFGATARLDPATSDASTPPAPAPAASAPGVATPAAGPRPRTPATGRSLALFVAFVSGVTSLGYQSLWTRLLSAGTGNSTYIFTTILVIFLVGIAGGAALFTAGIGRGRNRLLTLALSQVAVAIIAVVGLSVISGWLLQAPLTMVILISVLPATLVMGVALPIASGLAVQRDAKLATDTGLLLAVNTGGTVIGTFVVPFALIPLIGSPRSVLLLALLNGILGLALLVAHGRMRRSATPARRRTSVPLAIGQAVAVVVVLATLGSLIAKPAFVADPGEVRILKAGGVLFASAEDEIAAVQAGRLKGGLNLWVTGTSMTALTIDTKFMPLLPLMARPQSTSVLEIAFGMGSAYRTAVIAGLQTTAVELVPSVPSMFHWFYPDADAMLHAPNGRVIISDGRNHVELTSQTYDIVLADPPPPIESSGTGVLYSQEFYEASAARLNPGGVMMEWVPYAQNMDEFRAHVRTFLSVFPQVRILFGPGGYGVYMMGSSQPINLAPADIRAVLSRPGVADDLRATPDGGNRGLEQWIAMVPRQEWIAGDQVPRFAGTGPLITDDHPLTEYFLLRRLYGPGYPFMTGPNLQAATPR